LPLSFIEVGLVFVCKLSKAFVLSIDKSADILISVFIDEGAISSDDVINKFANVLELLGVDVVSFSMF
jgi:hypothetical protein